MQGTVSYGIFHLHVITQSLTFEDFRLWITDVTLYSLGTWEGFLVVLGIERRALHVHSTNRAKSQAPHGRAFNAAIL